MGQQKIHDLSLVPEQTEEKSAKVAVPKQGIKKEKEKPTKKEKKKIIKKPSFKILKAKRGKVEPKKIIRGKNYQKIVALIDKKIIYNLDDALDLVKKTTISPKHVNIEIHIKTNILSPKDNSIRTNIMLPTPIEKKQKIAVLTNKPDEAKKLGVEIVGGDDLIEGIKKGKTDFDILITTPDFMPKLAPLAKILGPKGLMPNPKNDTLTNDLGKTLEEIGKGKIQIKSDDGGNVHLVIGKVSFENQKIKDNIVYLVNQLKQNKPSKVKGNLIQAITLCTTMGPGIKIDANSLPD